jgi:uncharacterized SAM-binding protein YcdF (DUF218 family)
MFFALSKTLDVLVDPFWWVFALLVSGLAVLVRLPVRRRLGLGLVSAGVLVFTTASLPGVAFTLEEQLEQSGPNTMRPGITYDAVVLLGGTVSPAGSLPEVPAYNDNIERLLTTFDLLKTNRARLAIVSGGSLGYGLPTEAEYLARQLAAWGIDPSRVIVENQANNTRENATLVQAIVKERGLSSLVVVTSAFHMPRAQGCFRAVGLDADFLPVDYRMRDAARMSDLMPRAEFFSGTAKVVRERFGALVYRAMGYVK